MTKEKMMKLLKAYNDFTAYEYGNDALNMEQLLSDNGVVPVAFTTDETESHELQVSYDIYNECYLEYIDDELILKTELSLDGFISDLRHASFDDFVRDILHECDEMYERKALRYSEKYGIMEYTVEGNVMKWYDKNLDYSIPADGWNRAVNLDAIKF